MYDLPAYVWALVLTGVVGIPAVTLAVLHRGATATGLSRRTAAKIVATGGAAWAGWIAASALLARAGVYRPDPQTANPWLGVVFIALLAAALTATRIPAVSRILADPAIPARLAWPHTLRVAGGVFLIAWALGGVPAVFAIPAALGDIAIGLAAPLMARRLAHSTDRGTVTSAVWFNVLGILDLVVAVGIGFLAGLGPTQFIHVTPTTEALGLLPLALIPTTAVPLVVALHVVSLRRLRAIPQPAPAPSRPSARALG